MSLRGVFGTASANERAVPKTPLNEKNVRLGRCALFGGTG